MPNPETTQNEARGCQREKRTGKQRHTSAASPICGIGSAMHGMSCGRNKGGGSHCHGTVKHAGSVKSRSRERRGGDGAGGERRRARDSNLDLDSSRAQGAWRGCGWCIERVGMVGERRSWCDFGE